MFKLVARRRKDNQDVVLQEFYDERQFFYMINQANPEEYKEASILEYKQEYVFPICRMYVELKQYNSYFSENCIKKRVKQRIEKKGSEL